MTRLTRINGRAVFCGTELPPGPWHDEPDHVEFRSADNLPCILHRGPLGSWCGYVGVSPGHPWHGKDYNDVDASVHGGPTYSEPCQGDVCHVPRPGESDDVWWLGFDCIHAGDLSFSDLGRPFGDCGEYRTVEYARAETESLAAQAASWRRSAAPRNTEK